jgi:sigma-B regulation protein RsbU (phosphoserine phosphatase)
MPPLQFISTDGSPRLAIFSEVMRVVRDGLDVREAHRALVSAMHRAFPTFCYVEVSTAGLRPGEFCITRARREDGTEAVEDHSPWQTVGVPVRAGGVIAEIVARKAGGMVPQLSIPPDDSVFAELGQYRTVAATPGGLGEPDNWVLVFSRRRGEFNLESLENFVLRVGLVGSSLKNVGVAQDLRRANAFINEEVDRIAAIQRALQPSKAPKVPGLDFAAWSETYDRAGGDYYDYAELPGDRLAVIIADVSGHGPAAAVVAAMLNAILHAFGANRSGRDTPPSPGEVLNFANAQLAAKQIEQSFVTAFLGAWDPSTRTFTYARAGHNPPLLLKSSGAVVWLDAVGSLPLAILDETTYAEHVQPLDRGDVLVLFTDGIVEAANESREHFGEERLLATLRSANGSAADIVAALRQAVQNHAGGARSLDDQTLVVLRVL